MSNFIGLDLGSSAVKAVLMQHDGKILDVRNQEIAFLHHVDPEVLEIDSHYYYDTIFQLIKDLGRQVDAVDSISWVTAGGSIVLFDEDQNQLTPIVSWMDKRSLRTAAKLDSYGITHTDFYQKVGWPFSPIFPLAKLIWIKEEYPEIFSRIDRVCMTNDFLGLKLTDSWFIDESTAATLNFYDQEQKTLNEYFVKSIGLSNGNFPRIVKVGVPYGDISSIGIESTNLQKTTRIIVGSFDHPGAARAVGLHSRNQLLLSCGTSWVICRILPDRNFGLENGCLIDPYTSSEDGGSWFGMVSVSKLGMVFNRWATIVSLVAIGSESRNRFKDIDILAVNCDPADVIPVIDILEESPSEGYISNLFHDFSANQVARSLLESVVFCIKRRMIEKCIDLDSYDEVFLAGGPAESDLWPQIIADVLQKTVKVTYGKYAGAVGAARIAAAGIGVVIETTGVGKVCLPNADIQAAVDVRFRAFLKK